MPPKSQEITPLQSRTIQMAGFALRAVDVLCLGVFLIYDLLIVLFRDRIPGSGPLLVRNTGGGLVYIAALAALRHLRNRPLRWFIRTASVQLLFAQIYIVALPMQLIFVRSWQDPGVLRLEARLFGVQPTVWLERFVSPPLTEWMMFAYVFYIVIYPALSALLFFGRGESANEDFLFHLAAVNFLCFFLFFVFPIAGPLYFKPEAYTVPLRGGVFTAAGEYIRTHIHKIGGNLPSPHCAVATVMWLMARKHVRWAFYALAPVILTLYFSTFYLRFHYVSDSVTGILAGGLVILSGPALIRRWNAAVEGRPGGRA
jgi:hypothetical protein